MTTEKHVQQADPFNIAEFIKPYAPERIVRMFSPSTFLAQLPLDELDVPSLIESNRLNYDAMVEANKAAAATYRDMLETQIDIFSRMAAAAKNAERNVQNPFDSESVSKNTMIYADALESAFGLMREMAEAAQNANRVAFENVGDKVSAAISELEKR